MRILKLVVLALVAAALAGGGIWYALRPAEVAAVRPTRGDAAEVVYATGVVEPRTWAKITALVRERIVELCDCEGMAVERGKVLARLDDREAQASLAELRARQRLAAEELERQRVLAGRNVASQQGLDRARSEAAQIEALIAGQAARLESYVLRAPMSGVVLRRDGEVGEIADQGRVLFWVGQPRPLLVVAEVNEEDIPRIRVGQRALLRADAFPERALEATVDSITPKGDPIAKTYRVRLAVPADSPVMIGMTVDVNIVVGTARNALLLPAEAIDGRAIFVIGPEGVARRRELEIGIRGTAAVEVRAGLDETTRVITPFPQDLADGARVRAKGT